MAAAPALSAAYRSQPSPPDTASHLAYYLCIHRDSNGVGVAAVHRQSRNEGAIFPGRSMGQRLRGGRPKNSRCISLRVNSNASERIANCSEEAPWDASAN